MYISVFCSWLSYKCNVALELRNYVFCSLQKENEIFFSEIKRVQSLKNQSTKA